MSEKKQVNFILIYLEIKPKAIKVVGVAAAALNRNTKDIVKNSRPKSEYKVKVIDNKLGINSLK